MYIFSFYSKSLSQNEISQMQPYLNSSESNTFDWSIVTDCKFIEEKVIFLETYARGFMLESVLDTLCLS